MRQLNHAPCISHSPASWPGHVLMAMAEAQDNKQRQEDFLKFRLRSGSLPLLPQSVGQSNSVVETEIKGQGRHFKATWQKGLDTGEMK